MASSSSRSLLNMALIGLLGFVVGSGCVYFYKDRIVAALPKAGPPPAPQDRNAVEALGRLRPSGGVIAIQATPGDRVEEVLVKQGEGVTKDQDLVRLASHKDRKMEEGLARLQHAEAVAQKTAIEAAGKAKVALIDAEIAQLKGGRQPDLDGLDAKIGVIEAQKAQAKQQVDRLEDLRKNKLDVAPQDLEQARLLERQAAGELDGAKALRAKTVSTYKYSKEVLQAKRTAAEAETAAALGRVPVSSLEQAVKLAARRAELSLVKAPVKGTVLDVHAHAGDTVGPRPLLQIGGGKGLIAVAEVYETDVRLLAEWMKQGPLKVQVTAPALSTTLEGTVTRPEQMARLVARNALLSLGPRADVDRRVIEVKVDLQADSASEANHLVGLQVNVKFLRPGKQ